MCPRAVPWGRVHTFSLAGRPVLKVGQVTGSRAPCSGRACAGEVGCTDSYASKLVPVTGLGGHFSARCGLQTPRLRARPAFCFRARLVPPAVNGTAFGDSSRGDFGEGASSAGPRARSVIRMRQKPPERAFPEGRRGFRERGRAARGAPARARLPCRLLWPRPESWGQKSQ